MSNMCGNANQQVTPLFFAVNKNFPLYKYTETLQYVDFEKCFTFPLELYGYDGLYEFYIA